MSVTPATIAVALGQTAPAPGSFLYEQWDMWITDALMLIEIRRDTLGVVSVDPLKQDYVVREAVVAHVKRPEDVTQVTVAVDDASTSKSYRSGKGRVTILDEWWTLLGLTDPSGAFSLDMTGAGSIHRPWCSLMLGAQFCSCGADIAGFPLWEGDPW